MSNAQLDLLARVMARYSTLIVSHFNLNNDGEIVILASNIQSDIISKQTSIDVQLVIGTRFRESPD
jgi:hypothetical protein